MSKTAKEIRETLAEIAPHIAFSVNRTPDHYFSWDGDGPDPRDEGYDPYNVDVTATAIVNGKKVFGEDSMGGSYFKQGEENGDLHGYLPQMLEEAADELLKQLHENTSVQQSVLCVQLGNVAAFLRAEASARYDEKWAEIEPK